MILQQTIISYVKKYMALARAALIHLRVLQIPIEYIYTVFRRCNNKCSKKVLKMYLQKNVIVSFLPNGQRNKSCLLHLISDFLQLSCLQN